MNYTNEIKRRFFQYYYAGYNIRQAAIKAGVPASSAGVTGQRWMKSLSSTKLAKLAEEESKREMAGMMDPQQVKKLVVLARNTLNQAKYLNHLERAAFLDPMDIYYRRGGKLTMKPLEEIPKEVRQVITEMRTDTTETETKDGVKKITEKVTLKFIDKTKALEMLGRYQRLWDEPDEETKKANVFQIIMNMSPEQAQQWIQTGQLPSDHAPSLAEVQKLASEHAPDMEEDSPEVEVVKEDSPEVDHA
jgi:phage terminase small subunit